MKKITVYAIEWDNGNHASGVFPQVFTSRKSAERFGREWKRDMVATETTPEEIAEAKQDYTWDVISRDYFVEKTFAWPGHFWMVFDTETIPRAALAKHCPYKQVLPWILEHAKNLQQW